MRIMIDTNIIVSAALYRKGGIALLRDKKDYPILAAAMAADVDILLSGDKDLLTVEIERPEIINSKNFRGKYFA